MQEISGGRLVLGLGAGWNETEFDAFGVPFDHRASRFGESFEIIRRLLAGERVTYAGRFEQVNDAVLLPVPDVIATVDGRFDWSARSFRPHYPTSTSGTSGTTGTATRPKASPERTTASAGSFERSDASRPTCSAAPPCSSRSGTSPGSAART